MRRVIRDADGTYSVINSETGEAIRSGLTNSAAWRFVDIETGEAMNKAQDTSNWINNKEFSNE